MLVQIFDLTGKSVLEKNIPTQPGESFALDIAALNSGIYVVQITADSLIYTNRLLKE